jgi:hypothetical protein
MLRFPRGFLKASCDLNTLLWQSKYMPGWNADITTEALEIVEEIVPNRNSNGSAATRNLDPGSGVVCDEWVDHPVLVVQRDTFANFFHDRCVWGGVLSGGPGSAICWSVLTGLLRHFV